MVLENGKEMTKYDQIFKEFDPEMVKANKLYESLSAMEKNVSDVQGTEIIQFVKEASKKV